ncbi:MAG: hypothetical protein M3Y80_00675, partial [Verrucomicrobiota bacterium]|nr:hypothetical protein [Verrucomicrobiota bacterium]
HELLPAGSDRGGTLSRRSYWSEAGKDRHPLLGAIFALLEEEGWRYSTDTGWNEWDVHIYGNFWWSVALQTVTEYHGGTKCLTRVKLLNRFVATTVVINLAVLSLLIYHQLSTGSWDLLALGLYLAFVGFISLRARKLKERVAELVDLAAFRSGLQRMTDAGVAAAPSLPAIAETA